MPIATALWELNGYVGTTFDYFGYILYGLYYDEEGVGDVNQFMLDYDISVEEAVEAFNISETLVGGDIMVLEFDCE
ncbi:MAG: hypothetical protein P1U56_20260 [Saprospiraceae bacterium]|nr:hypothetical protein [Saprospiraceae bacterium]